MLNKNRKAFTMIELIMYMILIGLVLYPMAPMLNFSMKNLKENNDNFNPMLYSLIEDIKYDNTIASSIVFNPISDQDFKIQFNRLDGCITTYQYDESIDTLSRVVSSCATTSKGIRQYVINDINVFNLRLNDTSNSSYNAFDNLGNYEMRIESSKDSLKYRYVLYKK